MEKKKHLEKSCLQYYSVMFTVNGIIMSLKVLLYYVESHNFY